jgi:hypothetical protein
MFHLRSRGACLTTPTRSTFASTTLRRPPQTSSGWFGRSLSGRAPFFISAASGDTLSSPLSGNAPAWRFLLSSCKRSLSWGPAAGCPHHRLVSRNRSFFARLRPSLKRSNPYGMRCRVRRRCSSSGCRMPQNGCSQILCGMNCGRRSGRAGDDGDWEGAKSVGQGVSPQSRSISLNLITISS